MKSEDVLLSEHLAFDADLSLDAFCASLRTSLGLPPFEFDADNETEWGLVTFDFIEFNIPRPFKAGTLHQWDKMVPPECNFGVALSVSRNHPTINDGQKSFEKLVLFYAPKIVEIIGTPVYYHRTWFGSGQNLEQNKKFYPDSAVGM
jgi:hypothetical protein